MHSGYQLELPQSKPNTVKYTRACPHPECNPTECSQAPEHSINMMTAYTESYLSRPKWNKRQHHGLGHPDGYEVCTQRLINNAKLPKEEQLSLSQMQKWEILAKGTTPFDKTDPYMRSLVKWDLKTNPELEKHCQEYSEIERKQFDGDWIKWMSNNNCWVSYFNWFNDMAHPEIPTELKPIQFFEKIEKMFYGPSYTATVSEIEEPDEIEIVDYPEIENLQINAILEEEEEKQEFHN